MSEPGPRSPQTPRINPAAATPGQLAENFRRVFVGALADGRSLEGAQGLYQVRVLAPLEVTDEGIGLNLHDARVFAVLADLVNLSGGEVLVSANDAAAGCLKDKLLGDDGSGENLKVTLTELNDGQDEDLKIAVAKSDIRDLANGKDQGALELKIHYKGTDDLVETIDAGEWRGRLCRVWARAAEAADIDTAPTPPLTAGLRPLGGEEDWPVLAAGLAGEVLFNVSVCTEGADAGKLKLAITNTSAGSAEAWFYCRIDVLGVVPTGGYATKGNGL